MQQVISQRVSVQAGKRSLDFCFSFVFISISLFSFFLFFTLNVCFTGAIIIIFGKRLCTYFFFERR